MCDYAIYQMRKLRGSSDIFLRICPCLHKHHFLRINNILIILVYSFKKEKSHKEKKRSLHLEQHSEQHFFSSVALTLFTKSPGCALQTHCICGPDWTCQGYFVIITLVVRAKGEFSENKYNKFSRHFNA